LNWLGSFGLITREIEHAGRVVSLTGNMGFSVSATQFDTISGDVTYGNNPMSPVDTQRFTEWMGTIRYARRFSL
jgi:hypothetical protein